MNTISHIIIIVTNFQILVSVLNPLSPKKTPVEEPVEDQTQPTITLEVSTTRFSNQCIAMGDSDIEGGTTIRSDFGQILDRNN